MTRKWWHGAVFYHIYPRSFYDSDNNGTGDLEGVRQKLDYLEWLGVNAIWLSPFYTSPMRDLGYDVADYRNIDPIFGTMGDFDRLVDDIHTRQMKLIIDFVPNHTSSEHHWFKQSLAGKDSPKRDWYIWKDGQSGGLPPNNWLSAFGGSAWQFDKPTGQYYLHTFLKEQPDLNWDNPEVRQAMKDNMRFWLDKGVDGFRVDAVSWLSKDKKFRDDPLNPQYQPGEQDAYWRLIHAFSAEGDELFDYLNEMVDVCVEYGEKFMITEAYPETDDEISHYLKYYELLHYNLCAPFNFECISFPWDAGTYRGFIDLFQEALLPGQPPIYNMGNHDKPRLASRIGQQAARTAAVLLLSLPGIPFIYYGDEIGMRDVRIDPKDAEVPTGSTEVTRRHASRTPLQWSDGPNAGFSRSKPWLPVAPDYERANINIQKREPDSLLNLYRKLLSLRNGSEVLRYGTYRSLSLGHDVFGFVREYDLQRMTILLNFSDKTVDVQSRAIRGKTILSSVSADAAPMAVSGSLKLQPYEALILSAGD